jgi:hypothetical protein
MTECSCSAPRPRSKLKSALVRRSRNPIGLPGAAVTQHVKGLVPRGPICPACQNTEEIFLDGVLAEAELTRNLAIAQAVCYQPTTCSSRGVSNRIHRELTMCSDGTWLRFRSGIASVHCWPTPVPDAHSGIHLQSRRKGYWEKQNKPRAPERNALTTMFSIGVEQNDFGYVRVGQMQSAGNCHVRPNVFGVVGIKDGNLDR